MCRFILKLWILAWVFVGSVSAVAQEYIYPVKQDHKWGYIDENGVPVIPPTYDLIAHKDLLFYEQSKSPRRSGFKLMKYDNLLGLMGDNKEVVLQPEYQRIRPLTERYFAVRRQGEAFSVVKADGKEVVPPRYDDIYFLDTMRSDGRAYFKVTSGDGWGVHEGGGPLVLPMEYQDVELVQGCSGCFKVRKKNDRLWSLVKSGKIISNRRYREVEGFHENFIAVRTSNSEPTWGVLDSIGIPMQSFDWQRIQKLNDHWAVLAPKEPEDSLGFLYSLDREHYFVLRDTIVTKREAFKVGKADNNQAKPKQAKPVQKPTEEPPATNKNTERAKKRALKLKAERERQRKRREEAILKSKDRLAVGRQKGKTSSSLPAKNENEKRPENSERKSKDREADLEKARKKLIDSRFAKARLPKTTLTRKDTAWITADSFVVSNLRLLPKKIKFKGLDDRYIKFRQGTLYRILDRDGTVMTKDGYHNIEPYQDSSYLVYTRPYWGIYHLARGLVKECRYLAIEAITPDLGQIRSRKGLGIINRDFEEIVPLTYDSILVDSNLIKAYSADSLSIYKLDLDSGKVTDLIVYHNVYQISVGGFGDISLQEAKVIRGYRYYGNETDYTLSHGSPAYIPESLWDWKRNPSTSFWNLKDNDERPASPAVSRWSSLRHVYHIGQPRLSMLYSPDKLVDLEKTALKSLSGGALVPFSVFDHRKGEAFANNAFLGLRRHDFERGLPYAALIDLSGNFGLIDANGGQKLDPSGAPLRFTFIGEFIDGMARVCLGGKLQKNEAVSKYKYTVDKGHSFWKKFCLFSSKGDLAKGMQVSSQRLVIEKEGDSEPRWGFIDSLGNIIVPPQYDYARDLIEGQGVVVKDGKWGVWESRADSLLIDFEFAHVSDYYGNWKVNYPNKGTILFDRKGWEISSFDYEVIEPFSEGFSKVLKSSSGLWGFINTEGEEVVPCIYQKVERFSEGIAAVSNDGQWMFIDTLGQVITDLTNLGLQIDSIGSFSEGLCRFKSGKFAGFLSVQGELLVELGKYANVLDFKQGLARVVSANRKVGLIDHEGQEVVSPGKFDRIWGFNEDGVAKVTRKWGADQYELMNTRGDILTGGLKYEQINEFKEGLALAKLADQYGYLDASGKASIPIGFSQASDFSGGLAAVRLSGKKKWIYIKSDGKRAFPGEFAVAKPFDYGFARVQREFNKRTTKMLIDKKGKPVTFNKAEFVFYESGVFGMFDPDSPVKGHHYYYADEKENNLFDLYFEEIQPFQGDYAFCQQNRYKVILDKLGMLVLKPKYGAVQFLPGGYSLVRPPAFGIIRRNGEVLLSPEFDHVTVLNGEILKAEKGEQVGYMNEYGEWIWAVQK